MLQRAVRDVAGAPARQSWWLIKHVLDGTEVATKSFIRKISSSLAA
jgi:hypothetical protein